MSAEHHALFQILQSGKELRHILLPDMAEHCKVRRSGLGVFPIKPHPNLMLDEQLIRKIP